VRRARYEIVEDTAEVLCIRDLGPWDRHPTITNDAENVVADLASKLGARRLEYVDSLGSRDRLLVVDGRFAGFAPVMAAGIDVQRDKERRVLGNCVHGFPNHRYDGRDEPYRFGGGA
jgi:hypothetical protein